MSRLGPALALLVVLLAGTGDAHAQSRVRHDDFLWQGPISADASYGASLAVDDATREPGEPAHGDQSLWMRWTAPRSGLVEVLACSRTFTPRLALYTGFALSDLTPVPLTEGPPRCLGSEDTGIARRFEAEAGRIYRLAAATGGGARAQPHLAERAALAVHRDPVGDAPLGHEPHAAALAVLG